MLAEEVFAIFQGKIPTRTNKINVTMDGNAPGITIRNFGDVPFLSFLDQYGNEVSQINSRGQLVPSQPPAFFNPSRTPIITWPDPADIDDNTALSSIQLNATAADADTGNPVLGTFAYTPPAGTVLSAGASQVLNVVFTPTNTAIYTKANGTAHINVAVHAVTYVNSQSANNSGAASTTVAVNITVATGDMVLVFTGSYAATGGVTYSVTDSHGNPYSQVGTTLEEDNGGGGSFCTLACFWAFAGAPGTLTVTVTASMAIEFGVAVHRLSGTDPASPVTASSLNTGLSFLATTGTVGASSGDTIVATFGGSGASNYTVVAPYINTSMPNAFGVGKSGRHESVTGPEAATATTLDDSIPYLAIGVAIAPPP